MNKQKISDGINEDRIFKIGNSFYFAVQVPDDSVGCSGSRCSSCGGEVACCHHVCKHCKMPFIGPFGFPQLLIWEKMTSDKKWQNVREVHSCVKNSGRLTYTNVLPFPLNPEELNKVDNLSWREFFDYFCETHFV